MSIPSSGGNGGTKVTVGIGVGIRVTVTLGVLEEGFGIPKTQPNMIANSTTTPTTTPITIAIGVATIHFLYALFICLVRALQQ